MGQSLSSMFSGLNLRGVFGPRVTAEEVARGVDLSNRTVIVTGMHAHFSRSRSLSVSLSLCVSEFLLQKKWPTLGGKHCRSDVGNRTRDGESAGNARSACGDSRSQDGVRIGAQGNHTHRISQSHSGCDAHRPGFLEIRQEFCWGI